MSNATIRTLRAGDRAGWEPLWQGYLTFYETSVPAAVTDATWARLIDPDEPVWGLGAELDGQLVGIAHYIFHRSTWSSRDRCYLQDLFTAHAARRRGVGRALIEAVCETARLAGADRVYWLTHKDNATARALYDQIGELSDFLQYRKML